MQVRPFNQPWETNYQRQADDAFARAEELSAAELRALRPPLPQIQFLPPRFGYPPYVDRVPDIYMVFGIARTNATIPDSAPKLGMRQNARVDYSRVQSGQQGSDRNTNYDSFGTGSS